MKNNLRVLLVAGLMAGTMLSTAAFAQTAETPPVSVAPPPVTSTPPNTPPATADHGRINAIDERLAHQNQRIDTGLANGTMTPAQAAADRARDQGIANQLQQDEKGDHGHITQAEKHQMEGEENHNSTDIYNQRHDMTHHPRIGEVDQRLGDQERAQQRAFNNGKITQKQYEADQNRDNRTANQLSRDEAHDNGHITKGEQRQLNHEENHTRRDLRRQRHHDHPAGAR
jgi:hypothetical protein